MDRGWIRAGSIAGAPVYMHAAVPIALVATIFVLPLWVALLLTVIAHEFGHADLVRRCRLSVVAIHLTPLGGRCTYEGNATPLQRAAIAWGGVVGQLALVVLATVVWLAFPALHTTFGEDCFGMLVGVNAVVAFVNLVPFGPLDGREAWPLVSILVRRRLARRRVAARIAITSARPPRREDMN